MKDTFILGIETSCDETSAAVVKNGREVLSNVIFSQIDIHKKYGGVVPEIASRSHVEKIDVVIDEALSGLDNSLIDAIAVTNGPGLVGALLVGLSYAKGYAYAKKKPLIGINHIEGHMCANYISNPDFIPPYVCLVVSGGHTHLTYVSDYGHYEILGITRDDAAGEAFDKIARTLGLPYPGGVEIDRLAAKGNKNATVFPRTDFGPDNYDFSFSGLKSAVINFTQKPEGRKMPPEDIAASFQEAVVSILTTKAISACHLKNCSKLALAGGVAANSSLRKTMDSACLKEGISLQIPPISLCTDNAAMIASAGFYHYKNNNFSDLDLNAYPSLNLTNIAPKSAIK